MVHCGDGTSVVMAHDLIMITRYYLRVHIREIVVDGGVITLGSK